MANEPHHVQKQSIRLDVSSEAVAMALQTQLPDLNRTLLLATVERVLDSYAAPDRHIRIPRLSVNLGTIPFGRDFATEVNSRLERELREALDAALRGIASHTSGERVSQSADELRLDVLEQYLIGGTLPFWAAAAEFNPETVVSEAATATPEALIGLLRRHQSQPVVIRRLVGQLSDAGLRRLLELLDPGSAARIADEVEAVLRGRSEDDGDAALEEQSGRRPGGDDRRASVWMRVLTDAVQGRGFAGSWVRGFADPPGREAASSLVRQPVSPEVRAAAGQESGDSTTPRVRDGAGPQVDDDLLVRQRPLGREAGRLAELALSPYDHAEALKFYLRHGVLPWNAVLGSDGGRAPLTVDALLEAVPDLPLAVLRTIFPAAAGERYEAVLRVVERMPEQTRARLLVALSAEARPGLVVVEPSAGVPSEGPAAYARAILRMLDGEVEERSDVVYSPRAEVPVELPVAQWDVHWVKSVLAERARGGERAGPAESPTPRLLLFLIEQHPSDAAHFLRVLRRGSIAPAALLSEAVSPRLFQGSLMMLPGRLDTVVTLLLQIVRRLPSHEQPGDENAIISAATGVIFEHLATVEQTGRDDQRRRLAEDLLRALFGPTLGPAIVEQLAAEAERLARAGAASPEDLTALRHALAGRADARAIQGAAMSGAPDQAMTFPSPGEPTIASAIPPHIEHLPPAAAGRITQLLGIISSWPSAERPPATVETIRNAVAQALPHHVGADLSSAAFIAVVLRAILGPAIPPITARRLLADVEVLALRGELTSGDVEAVREALATLTDVGAPEPLRVSDRPVQRAAQQADQAPLQAEHIVAELTSRLRHQHRAGADERSSFSLLQTLVERSPSDARAFLQTMRDDGISPSSLIEDTAAPGLMGSSLELLRPLDRRIMTLLLRTVAALSPAERPASEEAVRATIARVALDHAGAASNGERIAGDALRALFGPTLPVAVQRTLVAQAKRIARAGSFGPETLIAFLSVIGRPAGSSSERGTVADIGADAPVSARDVRAATDRIDVVTTEQAAVPREGAIAPPAVSPSDALTERQVTPGDSRAGADVAVTPLRERGEVTPAAAPPRPRSTATGTEAAAALARLRGRDAGEPEAASHSDQLATPREPVDGTAGRQSVHDHLPRLSDDSLRHILLELVDTAPETVAEVVRSGIADPDVRARWIRKLTEPELARVIYLLEPTHHRLLISSAEVLFSAWDASVTRSRDASEARTALWSFLLELLARHAEGQRAVRVLVREFFAYLGTPQRDDPGVPSDRGEVAQRVFDETVSLASRLGRAHLRAVLAEERADLMALATAQTSTGPLDRRDTKQPALSGRPVPQRAADDVLTSAGAPPSPATLERAARLASPISRDAPPKQRMAFGMKEDDAGAGGEPIHLTNAGLVIVGAFLPQLFARLEVLEAAPTGGSRVRPDAVSRVVHLLQYLADGRTDAPEPLLCLNKVLCGVPLATPVDREIELTVQERELCDSLLAAMIENWPMMKSSSVGALRETFLQREGRLDHPPSGWRLLVQRKTLDVLLDHIPWPTSTIANSWMPEPLFVTW